jgi:hypothetical protein
MEGTDMIQRGKSFNEQLNDALAESLAETESKHPEIRKRYSQDASINDKLTVAYAYYDIIRDKNYDTPANGLDKFINDEEL